MPDDESITRWIGGLKAGDNEAALRIWQHYSPRVVALAETRLPIWLRRVVDGEDVAEQRIAHRDHGYASRQIPRSE